MMNGLSGSPSCSNGTLFYDLKPKRFWDCPFNNKTNNKTHGNLTFFYVMRQSSYSTSNTIIPFEIDRFNSDDLAMSLKTSVLIAPEDGIYKFSLFGLLSHLSDKSLWITLRLNGNNVGACFANNYISKTSFAQSSILKLNNGDQIDLYLTQGASYADDNYGTHFIGILLAPIKQTIVPRTSPVYFYVQRNSSFSTVGSIPFELAQLNEGSAMDIGSGVFTAPDDGIYHFSLSGIKDDSNQLVWVKLKLNGEMIGSAYATESMPWAIYHLQSILRLKKSDQIDLFLEKGTCYDDKDHWTHFIGSHLSRKSSVDDNVATSDVQFFVQRNSSYSVAMTAIPFELARLNEDGAMNLTTGIFTAPRDGIYRFSLFGIKDASNDDLVIELRKNRVQVEASDAYAPAVPLSAYSLQSVLHLKKEDKIDLFVKRGTLFNAIDYHVTQFIGYLLQ